MRILICLLMCSVCFSQESNKGWALYKNENGIAIYSRQTDSSEIKELKLTLSLKTSLNSIVALLNDWDSYPQWNYRCGESKTLKVLSETELIHYQSVKTPWPAHDQDFVINIKQTQDEKSKTVVIKSTNHANYIPPFPNRMRISKFYAKWTLIPLKDGTVQLTYEFLVKPEGAVPVWLMNMAIAYGPYETMLNFKEWIKKEKYQKAKSKLIKELSD